MTPIDSVYTTFPRARAKRPKPLATRPPSFQSATAQGPLSDHCPGHQLGASPCHPGWMTLVLQRLGQSDFSSSEPVPLSPPQLAPHPATQRFWLIRGGFSRALRGDTEGTSSRGLLSSICRSLAPALGRGRLQRGPPAAAATEVLAESPVCETPGAPWKLGGGGSNPESRHAGPLARSPLVLLEDAARASASTGSRLWGG